MRNNRLAGLVVLCAVCAGGCSRGGKSDEPKFRFTPITRATVVRTVEATGTVTPRNTKEGIPVGAQVNGRIIKLFVDYNSTVTNGQIVALIDPLVYEANYKSAVAQLHENEANVKVCEATIASSEAVLALAEKTQARKKALVEKAMAPIADLDSAEEALAKARAGLKSAQASLVRARAAVEQSVAAVSRTKADLDYCTLRSPVDGVVIARKVEEGETVVSSYNAVPVLTIAEDLKVVWIEATVPEADVGNIKIGQEVVFTADAYRQKFKGKVKQVRKAPTTTNNVVTYPIIIEAENPNEMLFPGMTATLSIETARAENAVVVSAAAFRFRPKEEDRARAVHHEKVGEIPRGPKLWLAPKSDQNRLEVQMVSEGISDGSLTQIVCEEAESLVGLEAVIGYQTTATLAAEKNKTNPFKQQFPKRGTNKGTAPEPKKK